MQDLDERNITDAVVATFGAAKDRRLKEVMTSLVRHLHDFARDVSLTPTEWLAAIEFLTRVGQTCSPTRQEFILLSDTMGLSALVNAMNSRASKDATTSSLLGPFFRENAPVLPLGGHIAAGQPGEEIAILGQVRDAAGKPIAGASIDIWQTSASGLYDIQGSTPEKMDWRGRFRTDGEGRYHLLTVRPIGYSIPVDGPVGDLMGALGRHGFRPAHIHFLIGADGYQELATALYLAGDPNIDSDAVFGVSHSLVVDIEPPVSDGPAPNRRRIAFDFMLAHKTKTGSQRVGADPAAVMPAAQ
jgi:protocatechuate 3,4-dioxygenase beta subunit